MIGDTRRKFTLCRQGGMKWILMSSVLDTSVPQCQLTVWPSPKCLCQWKRLFCVLVVAELFKSAVLIHRAEIITAAIVPIDSCVCPPPPVPPPLGWGNVCTHSLFGYLSYFCSCLRSDIELNLAVITFSTVSQTGAADGLWLTFVLQAVFGSLQKLSFMNDNESI